MDQKLFHFYRQTDTHYTDRRTFCIPIRMGDIFFYMEIYIFHYTTFGNDKLKRGRDWPIFKKLIKVGLVLALAVAPRRLALGIARLAFDFRLVAAEWRTLRTT